MISVTIGENIWCIYIQIMVAVCFHIVSAVFLIVLKKQVLFIMDQRPSRKWSYGFAVRLISSHCQSMAPSLLKKSLNPCLTAAASLE